MNYASLFSGIGSATLAFAPLGWKPLCFAETDPFCSAVLARHWPEVKNEGPAERVDWGRYRCKADLAVGGPPCTPYSSLGLRKGLGCPDGRLLLAHAEAINAIDPEWHVTENVEGLLNRCPEAFGSFLAELVGSDAPLRGALERGRFPRAGLAAGPAGTAAWRVFDAQHFGVAQRRGRVFVVGCRPGDFRCAGVLFEPENGRSHHPPLQSQREAHPRRVAHCLTTGVGKRHAADSSCLNLVVVRDASGALAGVRNFTPLECERLQGLPDGHTAVKWRGRPASKTARRRAVANAMPVPLIRWIARRIQAQDSISKGLWSGGRPMEAVSVPVARQLMEGCRDLREAERRAHP